MFAPDSDSIDAVKAWLFESGISDDDIKLSPGKNWLKFDATVEAAEALLKTKYQVYEHEETGQPHVACESYSVPAELRDHIDIITPTLHFDVTPTKHVQSRKLAPQKRDTPTAPGDNKSWQPKQGKVIGSTDTVGPSTDAAQVTFSLANCNTYITPDCLRALYNLPNGTLDNSSYGIVEYTPQAYLQSDLNEFYLNLQREIPSGTGPTVDLIDGAVVQTANQSFDYNGESDLDLEYAISLVYPQTVTLYQVGDEVEGASFNNFLDALDASYCTYDGGDDAT
jgi:tripeptidyl-peptidase-1